MTGRAQRLVRADTAKNKMEEGLQAAREVLVKTIKRIQERGERCPLEIINWTTRELVGTSHPVSAVLQVAIHVRDSDGCSEKGLTLEKIHEGINERLTEPVERVINGRTTHVPLGFVEVLPGSSYYCTVNPVADFIKAECIRVISNNIKEWWLGDLATVTFFQSRPMYNHRSLDSWMND